jgi:ATPase subunit of ABC transporter with duplicated ATPase domains
MRDSPATLLVVSHDRRLLETICDRLWVVGDGSAVAFDGGYRAWRAAVADGWTVADQLARDAARRGRGAPSTGAAVTRGSTRGGRSGAVGAGAGAGTATVAAPAAAPASTAGAAPTKTKAKVRQPKLSKDAYRKQKQALDAELTRLGLRKNHLELALGDPAIAANFVELRRVTSELADVDAALAAAEDAWLELEERAP